MFYTLRLKGLVYDSTGPHAFPRVATLKESVGVVHGAQWAQGIARALTAKYRRGNSSAFVVVVDASGVEWI